MGSVKALGARVRAWAVPLLLVFALSLSSGCALLLLGAGGMGGYMIRKGQEGDGKKKETSRVDQAYAARSDRGSGERL